jgi:protocatechuate 3,4-dioxygenase beta subunit
MPGGRPARPLFAKKDLRMPLRALALLVLVAIVGAGLWFVLRTGDSPPAPAGSSPPAADTLDQRHEETALQAVAGPPPAATTAPADATQDRTQVAVPTVAAAEAKFTVSGRLVDRTARPRANVEVGLTSWRADPGMDFPMPPDRSEGQPKTTTDANGRFSFAVAAGRAGMVDLGGAELVFGDKEPRFQTLKADTDLGDFTVLAASAVTGTVQDASGAPVPGVKVGASLGMIGFGLQSSSVSDAVGRFRVGKLRSGKHTLRTASGKYLPAVIEVEVAAEHTLTDVLITVQQGQAIAGQVVDDRGLPVADFKVGAKRKESKDGVEVERFTPDEAAVTDAGGWFTLAGLQGESATVRAWGKGHTTAVEQNVAVGTGNLVLHVQRLGSVRGVLRDREGKPIAGSRVTASGGRGGHGDGPMSFGADELDMPFPIGGAAITGPDGTFVVEDVSPGTVTVRARGQKHRPVAKPGVIVQTAMPTERIELVADLGATAVVSVKDDHGRPVAGAEVQVVEQRAPRADVGGGGGGGRARRVAIRDDNGDVQVDDGRGRVFGTARTDAEGLAEIAGLPAGPATVTAGHADLAEAVPANIVLPAAGKVEAALRLRQPGWADLRVTARDASVVAGTKFVVTGPLGSDAASNRDGEVDVSGKARVGPLAAGDYHAELQLAPKARAIGGMMFTGAESNGLRQTRVPFTVVAGQETVVELQKPILTRVHGRVTDAEGPLAGCVVELERAPSSGEGDVGIGLGGNSTRTDGQGEYELTDVEAGRYLLRWGKPAQVVKARLDLDVAANTPELRRDLRQQTGKLRVEVWSKADGEGVEGAEVELVEAGGAAGPPRREQRMMMITMRMDGDGGGESTTMSLGQPRAKTDADGIATIEDVPTGTYELRIRDDKHAEKKLADQVVTEGQLTDAGRVELEQAGRIRGKVLGQDGRPVAMGMVECRRAAGGDPQREPAMGGTFTFNGLAAGRYVLRAQGMEPGQQAFGPEVEVDVVAGRAPTLVDLQMPRQ